MPCVLEPPEGFRGVLSSRLMASQTPPCTPPLFITFEGLDGSGKSTHVRWVAKELEQARVPFCLTHEPGGTALGEALRAVFLDARWRNLDGIVELFVVFASRRQHLVEVIEPALARGEHVLCDRFTDSTLAYQGHGRGVPVDTILEVDRLATGLRRPDLTLLFDLPAEAARERGQSASRRRRQPGRGGVDRLDAEDLEFYRRVRDGYLELARRESDRFRIIDSMQEREATAEQVRAALGAVLQPVAP